MHVDFRSVDDFADSNHRLMVLLSESHQDRLEAPIAAPDASRVRDPGAACSALNAGGAFRAKLTIAAYTAEATLLRALKDCAERGAGSCTLPVAAAVITCETAIARAEILAREALAAIETGDTLTTMLAALRRLVRRTPADTVAAREAIAAKLVEMERWVV